MRLLFSIAAIIMLLPTLAYAQDGGTPATNAFTFQGHLQFNDMPVDITLDLTFQLFANPTGNGINDAVSPLLTRSVQFDERGRFSVLLDFGETFNGYPIFNGDERYMQIVILDPPGGLEEDIPLSPRTKLAAAPMAAYALNAPIPSLAEISNDHLVSTDELGSLSINLDDQNLGLTIRPNNGQGAIYSYTGIQAAETYAISTTEGDALLSTAQGDIHLNAGEGSISLLSDDAFTLNTSTSSITLDPGGYALNTISVDLDSSLSTSISSGATMSLSAAATLTLSSAITTINGNQFDGANVIINRTLLASGNAFKPGGGPWAALSDARQKKNIAPLHGSLNTLLSLRPVTYEYNDPANPMYLPGTQTGFIAQQVQPILPAWVDQADDGTLMLTPRGFEAMAVDAMQEQQQQINALQAENDELRARLDRLESMMRTLAAPE